jgi:uncharacterized protein (TIGR02246 family)
MKMRVLLSIVLVAFASCAAQQSQTPSSISAVRNLMQRIVQTSESQNSEAYASLFAPEATWDGPLGQSAMGQNNIKAAANLMFSNYGPLRTKLWNAKPLAGRLLMVDLYQASRYRSTNASVPVAKGSVAAPQRSDIRTTLIIETKNGNPKILAARIANLRAPTEHSPLSYW